MFDETIKDFRESIVDYIDDRLEELDTDVPELEDKIEFYSRQSDMFDTSQLNKLQAELDEMNTLIAELIDNRKKAVDIVGYYNFEVFSELYDLYFKEVDWDRSTKINVADIYNNSTEDIHEYVTNNFDGWPTIPHILDSYWMQYVTRRDIDGAIQDIQDSFIENNWSVNRSVIVSILNNEGLDTTFETSSDSEEFSDIPLWDELPFKSYNSGGYHASSDYSKWRVEKDTSLDEGGPNGVEIVSPVLNLTDAVKYIDEMFRFISRYGYTNDYCGFHINVSYAGRNVKDLDLLKVAMFMEEEFVYKHFPSRENNPYAISVFEKIGLKQDIEKTDLQYTNKIGELLFESSNKIHFNRDTRYLGINLVTSYKEANNRVEFRYLGGSNYEKKQDVVIHQMKKYCYLLELGFDNSLRKEEYLKKLYRLLDEKGYFKPEITSLADIFKYKVSGNDLSITDSNGWVYSKDSLSKNAIFNVANDLALVTKNIPSFELHMNNLIVNQDFMIYLYIPYYIYLTKSHVKNSVIQAFIRRFKDSTYDEIWGWYDDRFSRNYIEYFDVLSKSIKALLREVDNKI